MKRRSSRIVAFTLIELLLVIMIIAILIALLLPAQASSREATRRLQCRANLMLIGIACQLYHTQNDCLPIGFSVTLDNRYAGLNKCGGGDNQSWMVRILPYLEESKRYNSINHQTWISSADNFTSISGVIGTYACPSEPKSKNTWRVEPDELRSLGFSVDRKTPYVMSSSYAAIAGTTPVRAVPNPNDNCNIPCPTLEALNGVMSWQQIRFQSITDGLGMTMLAADRATTDRQAGRKRLIKGEWFLAGFRHTIATTLLPPNYLSQNAQKQNQTASEFYSCSLNSFHPLMINVLFCDGSVHVIRSEIDSWPIQTSALLPEGTTIDRQTGIYRNQPKLGVWQSLSTRSGGEVVVRDNFEFTFPRSFPKEMKPDAHPY